MYEVGNIEKELRFIMERIKWIKEMKTLVLKEENAISVPLLSDLSLVGKIHSLFKEHCAGKKVMLHRKQFIFVMLYFFSPSALGGSKMRRGLREEIAKRLGCTCSNVSHDYKNVGFYYVTYRKFRTSVNDFIVKAKEELNIKEKEA